jgi:hypothetical protein
MKHVKQLLIEAKALIEKPENWTRGVMARGKAGVEVAPESPEATCFCAMGALYRASKDQWNRGALYRASKDQWDRLAHIRAERTLREHAHGHLFISEFNDDLKTMHQDIMNLFDKAINSLGDDETCTTK